MSALLLILVVTARCGLSLQGAQARWGRYRQVHITYRFALQTVLFRPCVLYGSMWASGDVPPFILKLGAVRGISFASQPL